MPTVVEHRERGASARAAAVATGNRDARRPVRHVRSPGSGSPASRDEASPQAARARAGLRLLPEDDRRQRRAFRQRANDGGRRRHRLLSRAAHCGHAPPRHRLRRSLRAHSRPRQTRAAVGRRRRRLPRRRRAARRHGRAQALLARQLPVRAGSRARQSGVQALPPDRAREERDLAAPDQRRDREQSETTAITRSTSRSSRSRTSTTAWTT